jgi:hypothetical protein
MPLGLEAGDLAEVILYIHKHTHTHTHIYVHKYVYTCTHTYINTYIHTYTAIENMMPLGLEAGDLAEVIFEQPSFLRYVLY